MRPTRQAPLAVSIGDPSGIGADILLTAWARRQLTALPPMITIADIAFLERRASQLGLDIAFEKYTVGDPVDKISEKLPVLELGEDLEGAPGTPSPNDAAGTISSIKTAVSMCFDGPASGIVTCPINKKVLYEAGFDHPGHTEFLAELALQTSGTKCLPVMMLAGPELKTVPVTIHIPLADVPEQLTAEIIVETGTIVARDLKSRFGIQNPKLALAGLNPHAGEQGAIGKEDIEIIQPAVETLCNAGIEVVGPLPADTMFHASARKAYDVALCMYHDQALIPAKTLGFDDAVNVTLGLPFIRTSPDHGTAYDIAGTGKANPSSFIAALHMAQQMAANS